MSPDEIAHALGGREVSGPRMARCPSHDDRTSNFSIQKVSDGRALICCHASYEQEQAVAAVRAREFWLDQSAIWFARSACRSAFKNRRGRDDTKRTEAALAIWQYTTLARGTLMPGNDEHNVSVSKNERVEQ
jgi:hypothetical protein